jgi:hypothetical protein
MFPIPTQFLQKSVVASGCTAFGWRLGHNTSFDQKTLKETQIQMWFTGQIDSTLGKFLKYLDFREP